MCRHPTSPTPLSAALRPAADSRLHVALDAMMEAFWLLDALRDDTGRIVDFRVADLNLSAARAAGISPEAARGRRLGDLVSAARRLGHIGLYAGVVESGRPESRDFRYDEPGHASVWRRINAVKSGDGVVLTLTDITDRVEQEHQRAASEADLRLLAESATDMICRVTPQGRLIYVSPACREVVGFDPQEMVGREDRDFVHPDDQAALAAHHERLASSSGVITMTYRGRRKTAGWVRLEATSRGVCDAAGTLKEIRVSTRDVTERALAQAEHAALHRVSEAVAQGVDEDSLYRLVAAEMAHLLDADGGRVVRYLDDTTAEVLGAWRRASLPQMRSGERLALSPTWAIAKVRMTGTTAISQLTPGDAAMAGADLSMGIAAPVQLEGRVWGAVAAAFRDPQEVPEGAPLRIERFAKLVGLAVANAEARARLTLQATTDALTGLANHGTFHGALAEEFARTARYGRALSLAVIDLDHFKSLNDTFGHRAGDAALATVGALLRAHARQVDTVGRIGGEELAWLMPETAAAGALDAAERLRVAIAGAPIGGQLGLTASIGVAGRTRLEQDPEQLFRRADVALYRAKQTGRDRVVVTA